MFIGGGILDVKQQVYIMSLMVTGPLYRYHHS